MRVGTRGALGYLAVTGVVVGAWAYGFPAAFYANFPGLGHAWVAADGPFNQHLIRDTGAAYLMIGALAAIGLARPSMVSPFAVGWATLFFNLPHFAYHATHLGMYGPLDRVLNVVALGSAVIASCWLILARAALR